jgi:hypothetical protein
MLYNFIKILILTFITIVVVTDSYAQNTPINIFIEGDSTFFVSDNTIVSVKNGFVQVNTIVFSDTETFEKRIESKVVPSIKDVQSKIVVKVISNKRVANSEKTLPLTTISIPFQNFPNGLFYKRNNKETVPPPTVTSKDEIAKKTVAISNIVKEYFQSFLPEISLQNELFSTIQPTVLDLSEEVFFHFSRPPPSIV